MTRADGTLVFRTLDFLLRCTHTTVVAAAAGLYLGFVFCFFPFLFVPGPRQQQQQQQETTEAVCHSSAPEAGELDRHSGPRLGWVDFHRWSKRKFCLG